MRGNSMALAISCRMCPIRVGIWAGGPTPAWLLRVLQTHKQRDTYIGQLESAVVSSPLLSVLDRFPDLLSDRPVMHYIDNQGSLYSVINGRSSDDDTNRLVFVSRLYYARARCDVWYDYVPKEERQCGGAAHSGWVDVQDLPVVFSLPSMTGVFNQKTHSTELKGREPRAGSRRTQEHGSGSQ